ncbi:nucleotide-diphospho-sugar transferase [Radiomyces spectabilis]|uniref:nucleotide-diphospho-sugar transferase n=1 Tax=Radiomyces spectabilis TaxID=64574 RepID=UPI00221E46B6|nr:nucleotide-diphospho-sugar transferase [Radiomyces spectabilis]KAI8384343.1 nucleotide-diphospho-sugar transferase [Radiomyces spectabilis]
MATTRIGRTLLMVLAPLSIMFTMLLVAQQNGYMSRTQNRPLPKPMSFNGTRENAAFVVLVRNSELNGLRETMQQLEDRFNRKYNYPWIFLNDEPFEDKFKEWTDGLASGQVYYGQLNHTMWGYPDWIDQEKARESRAAMEANGVIYGGSESYRHMCRFQSGFFFRHPLLDGLDYYWRVEPHVKFSCDIDYDPFKLMRERDLKYGWTISIKEYESTIPTLWNTVKNFMKEHPEHIVPKNDPESLLPWISNDGGDTYNLCHFWSNFEIGSLAFLRSKAYLDFFNYLDQTGGFFYERWGDAPVHSIAAALMLRKSEVHWFYDVGYFHNPYYQCPREPAWVAAEKCSCDPEGSFDTHWYSCTPQFLEVTHSKPTDYLITQR